MTFEEYRIADIKKTGKLFALYGKSQLWNQKGTIFQIDSNGLNYNLWCPRDQIERKLKMILKETGKRFEKQENVLIIDNSLVPTY